MARFTLDTSSLLGFDLNGAPMWLVSLPDAQQSGAFGVDKAAGIDKPAGTSKDGDGPLPSEASDS